MLATQCKGGLKEFVYLTEIHKQNGITVTLQVPVIVIKKKINTKVFCILLNSTMEYVVTNEMREIVGRHNQEHCVGSCNHHHHHWAADRIVLWLGECISMLPLS